MFEKIAKYVVIFGGCFIIINIIGYIFNISSLITILNNPTGGGGRSVSNIPTILSTLITIIFFVMKFLKNNRK